MKKRNWIIIGLLLATLGAIAVSSLLAGRYSAPLSEQLKILLQLPVPDLTPERREILEYLVFTLRLPRIIAALLVGFALAMAGSTFQSMFRNPLVSPELLGVMAGSALGVVAGVIFEVPAVVVQLLAFAFGLLAIVTTLLIAKLYRGGDKLLILVMAGIICTAIFTSLGFLIAYSADPERMGVGLEYWLDGGLGLANRSNILASLPLFLLGAAGMAVSAKAMNVMSFGEEEAAALGLNPIHWRILAIVSATLVSAVSVTMAGMVAWIGLIAPHFGRLLTGPDTRTLLPVSGLIGASILLLADSASRSLFSSTLPMSLTISVIGIPMFMILLYRSKFGGLHV